MSNFIFWIICCFVYRFIDHSRLWKFWNLEFLTNRPIGLIANRTTNLKSELDLSQNEMNIYFYIF